MWPFFISLICLLNIFLDFFSVFIYFSIYAIFYLSYICCDSFFKIWYFLSSRCSYLLIVFLFSIIFENFWFLGWCPTETWTCCVLSYESLWSECNTSLLPEWVQIQFLYLAVLISKGRKEGCRKGRDDLYYPLGVKVQVLSKPNLF